METLTAIPYSYPHIFLKGGREDYKASLNGKKVKYLGSEGEACHFFVKNTLSG
jgi:hypothetical protein